MPRKKAPELPFQQHITSRISSSSSTYQKKP